MNQVSPWRTWALRICLGSIALLIWLPLWFLISGAFMGEGEALASLGPALGDGAGWAHWPLLPQYPTAQSLIRLLFDTPEFFAMFWNSIFQTVPAIAGQLLLGAPAAWAFAQYEFKGKNALFTLYIILMLMPFQVTMVPSYLVLDALKLLKTPWSVILPIAVSTFPVFLMTGFFKAIPKALLESARIDGTSEWGLFVRIGLPLGMPGIISTVVLGFLDAWNGVELPLTFLGDAKTYYPLSLYLPGITVENAATSLAASLVMLTPALLIFLFGQTYLEQGIAASGLKE